MLLSSVELWREADKDNDRFVGVFIIDINWVWHILTFLCTSLNESYDKMKNAMNKVVQMVELLEELYMEECSLLNIAYKGVVNPNVRWLPWSKSKKRRKSRMSIIYHQKLLTSIDRITDKRYMCNLQRNLT